MVLKPKFLNINRSERVLSAVIHGITALTAVILLIVAAFYDLQISHALSNSDSVYGLLFATLGEIPAYIVLPMSGVILFYCNFKCRQIYSITLKVISAILVYVGFFTWGAMGTRTGEIAHILEISAIYSMLLTVAALFLGRYIKINYDKYLKFALFALTVMLVTLIIIRLMKLSWGRLRYRDMLKINDFSGFTPWYLPQGATGMTSFPSGHSASACNIFIFVVLFKGKIKYLANFAAFLFVILTMFSRIVINAHFLSDVIMGASVSYICYYITKKLFERKSTIISSYTATSVEI